MCCICQGGTCPFLLQYMKHSSKTSILNFLADMWCGLGCGLTVQHTTQLQLTIKHDPKKSYLLSQKTKEAIEKRSTFKLDKSPILQLTHSLSSMLYQHGRRRTFGSPRHLICSLVTIPQFTPVKEFVVAVVVLLLNAEDCVNWRIFEMMVVRMNHYVQPLRVLWESTEVLLHTNSWGVWAPPLHSNEHLL